jgi:ligand-binding sensor domain-containing protein
VELFHKGGDGSVWAVVNYRGVFRVNEGGHWQRVGAELPIPANPTLLYCDRQGTLWLGTEKEIFFLGRGEKKFHQISSGGLSMAQSPDGSLWLKSHSSIRSIDRDGVGAEILAVQPDEYLGEIIFADSEGSIWSAGNGKGIMRMTHPENKLTGKQVAWEKLTARDGLTGDMVWPSIFQDREGNVWVATNKGVDCFRQSNIVPVKFPTSGGYTFLDGSAERIRV